MGVVLYNHMGDKPINCLEANEMSIERKNEIEAEYDAKESMAEMWY